MAALARRFCFCGVGQRLVQPARWWEKGDKSNRRLLAKFHLRLNYVARCRSGQLGRRRNRERR